MSDATATKTLAERLGPVQTGLRSDLEVTRHLFRGQPQYVVRDPLTFQTHQFSPDDYQILIALDAALTLEEVFQNLVTEGRLTREQEDDFYQFILSLHQMNYLVLPISDGKALYDRFVQRQRAARWRQASGFLFLRVPLVNPDAFLDRTADFVRPLFTRTAFLFWLAMMCAGLALLTRRWDAFKDPAHSILANETLPFIWFALIGLKVVHEFGHAYACKMFGGKVPEMGAYFIVFTPCAYMDASSAWGFADMRHRVIVSLAGMYFESIVAFLALMVWLLTEDPLISSYAHHVVVLSSIVTIGFNINPLMRYDGYYVLSDLTGIPNLRQRSLDQVKTLLKRWLVGVAVPDLRISQRERLFLLAYGISSAIYKVLLVLAICTMIALKFYMIGIALAAFFMFGVVSSALRGMLGYLWRSQETQPVRARAVALSLVVLVLVPAGVATVPMPGRIVVPGVVRTRDDTTVYAQVGGFLEPVTRPVGSDVRKNDVLCRLRNLELETTVAKMRAQTEAARVQYARSIAESPQSVAVARLRLAQYEENLRRAERMCAELDVVAPRSGKLISAVDLRDSGRYIHKGDEVATIAAGPWTVKCLVTAEEIADVHPVEGQHVRVRLFGDGVSEVSGTVDDVAVQGTRKIFSAALTQLGGGRIAVDPKSLVTNQPMFEIVVLLRDADHLPLLRGRQATVLFESAPRTYGAFIFRRFQQFMNRLRVH